jgi:hypothetical protein
MIKAKRAWLAGGPKRTSRIPLGRTARRIGNKMSINGMEVDKEGTINKAADMKDKLEGQEASAQW